MTKEKIFLTGLKANQEKLIEQMEHGLLDEREIAAHIRAEIKIIDIFLGVKANSLKDNFEMRV